MDSVRVNRLCSKMSGLHKKLYIELLKNEVCCISFAYKHRDYRKNKLFNHIYFRLCLLIKRFWIYLKKLENNDVLMNAETLKKNRILKSTIIFVTMTTVMT